MRIAVVRALIGLAVAVSGGIVPALPGAGAGVARAGLLEPPAHPLEPLSAAELQRSYELVNAHLAANGLPTERLLFPIVVLHEPPKSFVRGWTPGEPFPREATVQVMHYPSNRLWVAIVDLAAGRVSSLRRQPRGTQGAVTLEEYVVADEVVRAHVPWQDAMRRRGLDPDLVYLDVWAPGDLEAPVEPGTRLTRVLSFHRAALVDDLDVARPQNPYARPIEGVVVTVDMNRRRVVDMSDTPRRPVSVDTGNAAVQRPRLRPLRVREPEGSNVTLAGRRVSWQNWHFYVVLAPREGLVLYDVRYDDGGRLRPVAYRLSLSEVYVPYGVPDRNWVFRTAFDVGEYNLGLFAQTLETDRDVPENAIFVDAVLGGDLGPTPDNPTGAYDYPATVALYERHGGILWTRTDPTTGDRDTRFGRELVVTWNAWIGNYVYSFDWVFKQDASIEVRVSLTGSLLARGATDREERTAPHVGIDERGTRVGAGVHQHFINFRLDLDVDGADNAVHQSDVRHLPAEGFRNAFAAHETAITREGFADVNPASTRTWHVESASRKNALGKPTGYELHPGETAVPLSAPEAPSFTSPPPLGKNPPAFAVHPMWFTRYRDGELYAAGEFRNQGPDGAGLPEFVTPAQELDPDRGTDLVLWHTIGFTHVPRPEDHPVMPKETIGFKLLPHGFFSRNPALDVRDGKRP